MKVSYGADICVMVNASVSVVSYGNAHNGNRIFVLNVRIIHHSGRDDNHAARGAVIILSFGIQGEFPVGAKPY